MVELRQIQQFVGLAEELHFGRAASRLHISQPALSQSLARLEDALGVRLLERSNRRVALTAQGKVFLDEARRTLEDAEDAVLAARRAVGGTVGRLRLEAALATRFETVPALVARVARRAPGIEIVVTERHERAPAGDLGGGAALEIGVEVPAQPARARELIREERAVAFVGAGNPLAGRASATLSELSSQRLAIAPRETAPGFYDAVVGAFASRQLEPAIAVHAPAGADFAGEFAADGVALAPESAPSPPHVARIPICDDVQFRTWMVWRPDERPALQTVLHEARTLAQERGWLSAGRG